MPNPSAFLCDSASELGVLRSEWDHLAVAAGRPYAAPGWALAWWEHLRPEGARLRIVVVADDDGLAGILPFYARGRLLAPLGPGGSTAEPLARPGAQQEVAAAAVAVLASSAPKPSAVELETLSTSPDWAGMLAQAWTGRRAAQRWPAAEHAVPGIDLGGSFEDWMKGKSSSFRREAKRKQRKLDEEGCSFRCSSADGLADDVGEFMRLHRGRLAGQGGSSLTDKGVERMLVTAGEELLESGRFRLLCLERGGETIGAQLLLAAGPELSAWNSGFDERYSKLSPSMQCLLHALADASERGEKTMSLGPGDHEYKRRLADGELWLRSELVAPSGSLRPLKRLRHVAARRAAVARRGLRRLARR